MTDDFLARTIEQLAGRVGGPLTFRFVLQPLTAVFFAWKADVELGDWTTMRRLCVCAFLIDAIYQLAVLRWFYPGQALIVVGVLAVAPYVLVRVVMHAVRQARKSEP